MVDCKRAVAGFPPFLVCQLMSRGHCGLREPAVAAAARAAAPTFFAWRQRRRRRDARAEPSMSLPRRRRPERLRDRIRAVSHRISSASRRARQDLQESFETGGNNGSNAAGVHGDCLVGQGPTELSSGDNKKDAKLRSELLSYKIALPYTTHVALSSGQASDHTRRHFDSMFRRKGLIDTELYQQAMFWSSIFDEMMSDFMEKPGHYVFPDRVAYMQSRAVERIARFLFGMELALRPVTSAGTLDAANWAALRALDLDSDDTRVDFVNSDSIRKALREARREASRRKRLKKFARKWGGSSESVASMGWQQMLADWQRDWNDWGSPTDRLGRPLDMERVLQSARSWEVG